MILPQAFSKNAILRQRFVEAMKVMELAFEACDNAEDMDTSIDYANPLGGALKNAERVGIARYKNRLRTLTNLPPEDTSDELSSYHSMDEFDRIGANAIQAAEEEEARKAAKNFKKTKPKS